MPLIREPMDGKEAEAAMQRAALFLRGGVCPLGLAKLSTAWCEIFKTLHHARAFNAQGNHPCPTTTASAL
jgi:hypothetical protein